MTSKFDLLWQRFERLRVEALHHIKRGESHWLCYCDCGKSTVVTSGNLINKRTKSCGCLNKELIMARNVSHGCYGTPTYRSWAGMLTRCTNSKEKGYKDYGGRGIKVCGRWKKFENFFEDMGECPKGLTLERKNNDGNYEKDNCRWATRKEQANNTRSTLMLTVFDKTLNHTEWCNEFNIKKSEVYQRIRRGWSIEKALTTPVKNHMKTQCIGLK